MVRYLKRRVASAAVVAASLLALATGVRAFSIQLRTPDGDIRLVASSIGTIARRGSTFQPSEFGYKMTSKLFTYPDYPELGYDTPENEEVARAEAERINGAIRDLHSKGIKALAHSYEIEVPLGFIPLHPELECSGAGHRPDGNRITWFIPEEKSGGLCMYKPGARLFIQRRFDELFRRLPDLDGVIFSLNESAVRPYRGTCSTCAGKTLEDKVRDMIILLDDAVTEAMHKVRPDKDPYNVARSWGVPEFVAKRDPEKIKAVAQAFLAAPDDVPIVIKVGYGDYDVYMDTAPVGVELAKADSQPFLLDVGRRGVEPYAPGIFGKQHQRFVQETVSDSVIGLFYSGGRPESDGHPIKLNTLNWDTCVALFRDPHLDMLQFYRSWAAREFGLDPPGADALAQMLLNWEDVMVLAATQNGCDWYLAGGLARLSSIDFDIRPGSRWTWNYNWMDKSGGQYGLRANIYEAVIDKWGTPEEKYRQILGEKQKAVRLSEDNIRLARKLEGKLEATHYADLRRLLHQASWWARSREALARAYWAWWFNPRTEPDPLRRAYSEYIDILREPVGSQHYDSFMDEREGLEVLVTQYGFPAAADIYSFGAADLAVTGVYEREPVSDVERGDPQRFWLARGGEAAVSARLPGPAGRYELAVKYRTSPEGAAMYRVVVGDKEAGAWQAERTDSPSDYWKFFDVDLERDDVIRVSVEGDKGAGRLYRLHLTKLPS